MKKLWKAICLSSILVCSAAAHATAWVKASPEIQNRTGIAGNVTGQMNGNFANDTTRYNSTVTVVLPAGTKSANAGLETKAETVTTIVNPPSFTGDVVFGRNIQFLQTQSSISAGGFTFSFNPLDPASCGNLKFAYSTGTSPASFNFSKSIKCSKDGTLEATGDIWLTFTFTQSLPNPIGLTASVGLAVDIGGQGKIALGPKGEFDAIPYPVTGPLGVRVPDYIRITAGPYIAARGTASVGVQILLCNLSVGGTITLARVAPTLQWEYGYRRLTAGGESYETYTHGKAFVMLSGGDGSIWAEKSLSVPIPFIGNMKVVLLHVDIMKWDPIYLYNLTLYDVKTLKKYTI